MAFPMAGGPCQQQQQKKTRIILIRRRWQETKKLNILPNGTQRINIAKNMEFIYTNYEKNKIGMHYVRALEWLDTNAHSPAAK